MMIWEPLECRLSKGSDFICVLCYVPSAGTVPDTSAQEPFVALDW